MIAKYSTTQELDFLRDRQGLKSKWDNIVTKTASQAPMSAILPDLINLFAGEGTVVW